MGIWSKFWWPDALPEANPLKITERTLGAGNFFSGSWNSTSVPTRYISPGRRTNWKIHQRFHPYSTGGETCWGFLGCQESDGASMRHPQIDGQECSRTEVNYADSSQLLCKFTVQHSFFPVVIWNCKEFSFFIILYFENVAFFHAKVGSDVCPRIDNQTSVDILQDKLDH